MLLSVHSVRTRRTGGIAFVDQAALGDHRASVFR